MNLAFRRKQILFRCILFSLLIHSGAAIVLQRSSVWLYPTRSNSSEKKPDWLACMSKEEKTQILKTSLELAKATKAEKETQIPQKECSDLVFNMIACDPTPLPSHLPFTAPALFHPGQLLVSNAEAISTFSLPEKKPFDLSSFIPKDLLLPSWEGSDIPYIAPIAKFHPEETMTMEQPFPKLELTKTRFEVAYTEPPHRISFFSEERPSAPPVQPPFFHSLPELPTLEQLETSSYAEEFDTDLVFMPLEEGAGYLFALTLIPKVNLQIPKMKQHYMFLIDRANSIQKERLIHTKAAVLKAIEGLNLDDTFNIIVFDSKMEKLSAGQLPANRASIVKAKEFLQTIELGSFFAPADLYKPLLMTVPYQVKEDEVYTAIVATDGDYFSKKNGALSLLQQWTLYNQGKVTLYTIGMNGDKHASSLEALSALNRGIWIETSTRRGFRRKMLKLMKTIEAPIVKNISCQGFSRAPYSSVKIYSDTGRTQHLYANQPYVIVGTTDTLDDFILFIQGRVKNRWLNIKKTISFISARKGDASLQAQWSLQKAYDLYQTYLRDKNPKHLTEAKSLVEHLNLPVIFQ